MKNFFSAFLLLVVLIFSGCSSGDSYKLNFISLGTTIEITILVKGVSYATCEAAAREVRKRVENIDGMLSIFNKKSVVSLINNDTTKKSCRIDPELCLLIRRCLEYHALTQGAFDITVEPLVEAWGFGSGEKQKADSNAAKIALDYVGMDKLRLDDEARMLTFEDPRVKMDFGAIAKGYAVDESVAILKRYGIKSAIINMGGDLYCLGVNSSRRSWSIGVRDPDEKNRVIARLRVRDAAVATSGDYENFYIDGGREYTHIIDPRTGGVAANNLRSVTIIADDCTTADALATAIFVMGERGGLELINKLSGINALLLIKDEGSTKIKMSKFMKDYLEKDPD